MGVDVAFADGSTGTYDLVVGADGIHSSIRQLVFGGIRPRHLGQVSWRFLVDQSGGIETWTAMLASRRVPAMPVGPNRLYCYADLVTRPRKIPTGRDRDRFRALFADFGEPVEHPEQARELRLNPFLSHRRGRPRQLDLWACGASWRRGARDIAQHGRGCVHGAGRCAGAGPDVGYPCLAGGGLASVRQTPSASHPMGATANTPQGPHSGSAEFASQSGAPFGRNSHLSARLSSVVREAIASERMRSVDFDLRHAKLLHSQFSMAGEQKVPVPPFREPELLPRHALRPASGRHVLSERRRDRDPPAVDRSLGDADAAAGHRHLLPAAASLTARSTSPVELTEELTPWGRALER